ncbi:hypothetical protein DIURU_001951 [Diutina rugosa]|uniref:Protein CSF1 n=1 Tax=Diutina rugosa TaxID=5481 RepID=A0A642URX6_DIURU|nr:uncharacterized protein DIURU_001951 [Diutina rugosa]KAA8904370.1 hypothetical protein DIURU_001951 [Diutina rugosa]
MAQSLESAITVHEDRESIWIYLSDWILACILGWFLLFYFDRYVGLFISWLCKLVLWRYYKTRVNVESFKISFLAGRMFAKNVTIINGDRSISLLNINITWRYWLFRRTRVSSYIMGSTIDGESPDAKAAQENESLPTRFMIMVDGLEVFWYNCKYAYDDIAEKLQRGVNGDANTNSAQSSSVDSEKRSSSDTEVRSRRQLSKEKIEFDSSAIKYNQTTLRVLLKIFPVGLIIKRGAIVIGNPTVPTLMCVTYKQAAGILDIAQARSRLDPYRMLNNFNFDKLQLTFKANIGFDKDRFGGSDGDRPTKPPANIYLSQFQRALNKFDLLLSKLDKSRKKKAAPSIEFPQTHQWRGLHRYLDGSDDVFVIDDEEYAKVSTVLDTTSARLSYYYDFCGHQTGNRDWDDPLPEHAVEIEVSGAIIQYGAWADKQRIPLQRMFFPVLARDSPPVPVKWSAGARRQFPGFTASLQVKDELVLRIPTREPNKDKERLHKGHASQADPDQNMRPFGWLELKMGPTSNFGSYTSFVSQNGSFPHRLDGYFCELEVRSSVNHDILFMADSHELNASVGFPLAWNGACDWTYSNVSMGAELYLLREHVFLMADIFSDFASGDPTPYEFLREFTYRFDWKMLNYQLFFNVNDHNIISNPLDRENNTYLAFSGSELLAEITTPLVGPLTKSTTIHYKLSTPSFNLELHTPPWHTTAAFMRESMTVGQSGQFDVGGSYTFFDVIEVNASNYIEIRCHSDDIMLKFYGFVIKYLFLIRENYFGDFVHFKTFEEYLSESPDEPKPTDDDDDIANIDYWKILKTDNDVDVFFTFQVRRGIIILPAHVYNSSHHVSLMFDTLDVDIRFTNYYMDLEADFSPVFCRLANMPFESFERYFKTMSNRASQGVIDGLGIHAHRMFGIPPAEITYNAKWDFEAGQITIDSDPNFMKQLIHAIKCTAFGFSDMENSLNIPEPPVYDAFSITFQCPVLKVGLKVSQGGRLVTTVKRLLVSYNDYPNNRYSGRVTVLAPVIDLEVYNPANFVVGAITTSLTLNNFVIKHNGAKRWQLQQRHIQKNDAPFHRDPFLLAPQYRDKQYQIAQGCFATSLTLPDAHAPLRCGQNDSNSSHGSLVNSETTSLSSSEDPTIWPTANYDEEEFTPEEPTEAEFEYDNIVVEVGNVDGFFGLVAANIVVDVADSWSAMRLESIMDELQIKVVSSLKRLMNELKAIINARVVASKVNLLYGDFAVKDTTKVNRDLAIAQISIDELSVAVSSRQEKEAGQHLVERVEHMSAAGHVKRVSINVFEKSQKFFDCLVEDIEMWMTQSTGSEPVISAHVENVAMMLEDSHWLYLINLLEDTKARVKPLQSRLNVLSEKNHDMLAKFVYLLTKVSTDYEIDHDPGVLTKPAYVLRSRPEHVRFFDGWKLTARIRHLLDSLPVEWRYQPDMFSEPLPANAYEFVTNVFSRWRSWEADDDQRKFFFDFVFNREIKQPESGLFFEVKLSGMSAQLQRALEFDFVAIENLTTVMKQQEVYQAPLNKFGVDLLDEATTFDVVLNIGSVKGKMSSIVLNLLQSQLKSNRSTERDQKQEPEVDHAKILSPSSSKSQNIFVSAVVGIDYSLNINLPLTSIDISGDVNSDIEVLRLETIPLLASVAMQGNLDVGIFADDHQFAHLRFAESEVVGGLCGDDVKVVEILVEKIKLQGGLEVQQVKMVLDDVSYLRSIFESGQDPDDVGKQSEVSSEQSQRETQSISEIHILKSLGDISLSISVSQFVAEPQLDPLFGTIIVRGIEADVSILPELLSVKASMIDMRTQIKLRNVQVLFVEVSGSNFVSEIIPLGNVLTDIMANARLQTRECRVEIPQLVNALKAFIVNSPILESKASELKELFPTAEKSTGKEISEPKQSKKIQLPLFKISVICTLVSISTMVNDSKVSFELHDNKIAALNVEHMEHGIGEVPIFGEAVVNSTRLVLDNRAVNVNQSNVLDVNLNMRVFNHLDDNSQAIQLKSQWCRVCLTSTSLTKLLTCADVAMAVWSTKPPRQAPTISANTEHASSGHSIFAHFSSIQILAYNFCLGWLFTNSRKDYPGVNMGAERFFAILDREMGKFTLLHAYISVANGNRASNFFSTGSEVSSLNRAFLPRMQVIYSIEEDADGKDMRVMVMGDAVDIKYLSNSIVILEQALESSSEVENYLSSRKKRTAHAAHPEPIPGPAHSHKPMFKQVEVTANFEGSKILLYRIEDCEPESPGSLYLSSPSVRVAMLYKHLENASKSHELKLDVFTSSSSNILHSQCVPILSDIVSGIRRMMRKQNPSLMPQSPRPDSPPITPHVTPRQPASETFDSFSPPPSGATHLRRVVSQKSEAPSPAPPQKQDGIMNFLSQLDLHVGLRIQSQRLTLSCEPTVKVAAEVGMEGIHFQVNSGIKDGISMLVSSLLVEDVSASLQHVYSREISARVGVRAFTWSSVLELGETASILSSGNLTDVDGYVNVKQISDVELFKDIWFPRDWDTSDDDNVSVAVTPKMSHRFEEVSTTNAFPWVLTLVLTNLKVSVDFGSKLGDFSLVVNQGWVVSRKSVDWTQDLKAGVDEISLTSVGRLGCVFRVEELSIHTSISWKLEDEIVEVPLVSASAGVRHVGAKLSFDDHIFAMAVFEDLLIDVFNQKSEVTISKDHLSVQIVCHSAEIFVTTLTAASFMDIHNTVDRMMQEKRTNYKETLRDGVKSGNGTKKSSVPQSAILQTVKKLESFIQIVVGHLVIYVFPSSFEDSKVLMVKLDKSRAQFSQNEYQAGTTDELELKFNDLRISLSKIPPSSNEFVQVCTVLEFSEVAHKASGGGIFAFPSFRVSMRSFQKYDDNVVEYLYQSSFGGTVDIKWNLGSVNFIREMYMIHKRALDSRRGLVDGAGLSTRPFPESPSSVNKEIENAIDSSITKVERSSQFIYKPLAPPIIEAPQLKELGNATPPLEWFGLHRNNFPDVTHQVVIVGLQRVTHEVESQYTKLLGKA